MKLFVSFEHIDWTRMAWIVGIVIALWIGLDTVLPANVYHTVSKILAAIQAALLFAARGSKYVVNRTEPPADGKP